MMRPKCQDPMPYAIPAQRLEGDHGGDGAMVCAKRRLTWGTWALWVAMVMVVLQGPLAESVEAQEGSATKTTEVHRNLHHEQDDLHHDKGAWILGPKALAITIVHEDKVINTFGGGLSLERNVVEGWLEVELVAALFEEEQHAVQSFELLAKKPFHFGSIRPYLGLGLATTLATEKDERMVALGGAAVLGSYVWFSDTWGMDVELSYNLLLHDAERIQEIVVAVGPALRF